MKKWSMAIAAALFLIGAAWVMNWQPAPDKAAKPEPANAGATQLGVLQGMKLPPVSAARLNGEMVELKPNGRPLVINFWATWCPPCREEIPELQRFAAAHAGDVDFYAINLEERGSDVQRFLTERGLRLPVLLDEQGQLGRAFRISAIPTTLIVAADGTIVLRKSGAVDQRELEQALPKR